MRTVDNILLLLTRTLSSSKSELINFLWCVHMHSTVYTVYKKYTQHIIQHAEQTFIYFTNTNLFTYCWRFSGQHYESVHIYQLKS